MAERRQRDPVERRLQQLGAESERVRQQISRLRGELSVKQIDPAPGPGRWASQTGDLFAWAAKQRNFERTGSISVRRRPLGGQGGVHRSGPGSRARDPRLRAYLQSGSFGRLTPIRQSDDVPRNRLVFFAVVSLVLAYAVYRMVSH
jgi:hypothetical protein